MREETHCCHMGYSFQLTARVLLYAPSHRQHNTYHSLCYTSHGALAGTRNSSMTMGPLWRFDPTTHRTMSEHSYHGATSHSTITENFCSYNIQLMNCRVWIFGLPKKSWYLGMIKTMIITWVQTGWWAVWADTRGAPWTACGGSK